MKVPNHVAIILDGTEDGQKQRECPVSHGHVKGCANLETICDDEQLALNI